MPVVCPHCHNDNGSMIETFNHRREQMNCNCLVCSKSWVEKFEEIPKENILPPQLFKKG